MSAYGIIASDGEAKTLLRLGNADAGRWPPNEEGPPRARIPGCGQTKLAKKPRRSGAQEPAEQSADAATASAQIHDFASLRQINFGVVAMPFQQVQQM